MYESHEIEQVKVENKQRSEMSRETKWLRCELLETVEVCAV